LKNNQLLKSSWEINKSIEYFEAQRRMYLFYFKVRIGTVTIRLYSIPIFWLLSYSWGCGLTFGPLWSLSAPPSCRRGRRAPTSQII